MQAHDRFPDAERRELTRAGFSVIHLLFFGLQKNLAKILLVFAALSVAYTSSAKTMTVEKYLKDEVAFTNFHSSWLDGVFNGLKSANAELRRTNKAQLFCPPANFSMAPQQVNALFAKFIASHSDKVRTSDPIAVLLLEALQEAYPCAG
jgi:Rap1a immunity proteins